jgi:Cu-processing system permease protein
MLTIARYVFYDIIKNKVIIAYTLFLLLVSMSLFQLEEDGSKAILSLMNVVLIVVPLVSVIFTTIHYYNSYEFIELMLSQPVSRKRIITSEFAGTALSLSTGYIAGIGVPVAVYHFDETGLSLIFAGLMVTLIFSALGFLVAVLARDKARGIGAALLLWFYFSLIYDGLILLILFAFADYPLEKLTLALSSLNPIDLARIFLMLKMDVSALMGYTGATYKQFFEQGAGTVYTGVIMLVWALVPFWMALLAFRKKDL